MEFRNNYELQEMTIYELGDYLTSVREYEKSIEKLIEAQKWQILKSKAEEMKEIMKELAKAGISLRITTPEDVFIIHSGDIKNNLVFVDVQE